MGAESSCTATPTKRACAHARTAPWKGHCPGEKKGVSSGEEAFDTFEVFRYRCCLCVT
jgi:hypothetical protein